MMKLIRDHHLLSVIVLGLTYLNFGFMPSVSASNAQRDLSAEEAASTSKPAPSESLRVKEQKEKGILEEDRNYAEKSDWVKNRDRVEGVGQKIGDAVKDLF
jgi:hypothetical protein